VYTGWVQIPGSVHQIAATKEGGARESSCCSRSNLGAHLGACVSSARAGPPAEVLEPLGARPLGTDRLAAPEFRAVRTPASANG
jgi:hypothetical protein